MTDVGFDTWLALQRRRVERMLDMMAARIAWARDIDRKSADNDRRGSDVWFLFVAGSGHGRPPHVCAVDPPRSFQPSQKSTIGSLRITTRP